VADLAGSPAGDIANGAGARPSAEGAFAAESPWIRRAVREQQRQRLVCFPYAGAGASLFRSWPAQMPADIEVVAVQLPGREDRSREPPPADLRALVRRCAIALRPYCTTPFSLYGHCAGALLAYEVAHEMGSRFGLWPERFIAAAQQAPSVLVDEQRLHELPDEAFLEEMRRRGGIPQAVLGNQELVRFLLPLVRADVALWERYEHRTLRPLRCPVVALRGRSDDLVSQRLAEAWADHTEAVCTVLDVDGDHYFVHRENTARVLAEMLLTG
jgi:medium-chain acyl-[acyl-carrier-protein] hydrolase